jgi:hypothetical protein
VQLRGLRWIGTPGNEEEKKTKKDLEEVSYGRGTERRKGMEGGEEVGSRQKSLEKLRDSPLLLHRRQLEIMMMKVAWVIKSKKCFNSILELL